MGTRYVGVAAESEYGGIRAPTDFLDVVTESIVGEQNILYPETAGVGRSLRVAVPGPWGESGDIELIVGPENIEHILRAALGSVNLSDSGDGAYMREYYPSSTIPSLTIEVAPDIGDKARRIPMAGMTSLAFEAVARELLTCTASVIAKYEQIVDATSPTFSTKRPFVFYDGCLKIDAGTVGRCEAWRGTYENTIADDAYVLCGTRYLPTLIVGPCNFTGDMDIQFLDWSWYQKYLGGGTTPAKTLQSLALDLDFVGDSTGSTQSGYENYRLRIELPKVYLNTAEASFDRRERIIQSCDWQAVYDATTGYMCKITLVNTRTVNFAQSDMLSEKFTVGT